MLNAPSLLSFSARRRSVSEVVLVAFAIAALAVRAVEITATPVAFLRILLSVLTVGFICFAPVQTLARRAIAVIVFEALVGSIAFAFIDLPLVLEHRQQIGTLAVGIAERVERVERSVAVR